METQIQQNEELVRFRRLSQQQERNVAIKDNANCHANVSEDTVTSGQSSTSPVHTMLGSFQAQLSSINTFNVDLLHEVYELSHLLMRIFFISNSILSILFNAVNLFYVTLRAVYHIAQFVVINTTRITRMFGNNSTTSVLSDAGIFSLEVLVLAVMLFKIFVPTCIYMAMFILNVICYYVPRSLSILLSLW